MVKADEVFPDESVSVIFTGMSFPAATSVPPSVTVNVTEYDVFPSLVRLPTVNPPIVPETPPDPEV